MRGMKWAMSCTKGSSYRSRKFPPESLPTIDEAKALVAAHRQAREDFVRSGRDAKKLDLLRAAQAARREKIEAAQATMTARHRHEVSALSQVHLAARRQLRTRYLDEARRVKEARAAAKPSGPAAFLGRVTGASFVMAQVGDPCRTVGAMGTAAWLDAA